MKKYLLLISIHILLLPFFTSAQGFYYPVGFVLDSSNSTTFTFSNNDSFTHFLPWPWAGSITVDTSVKDTSSTVLWQIGNSLKPVFSNDTIAVHGIMTDTLHPYPKNANASFLLKMDHALPNFIVYFWHKYETDSFHAGGI